MDVDLEREGPLGKGSHRGPMRTRGTNSDLDVDWGPMRTWEANSDLEGPMRTWGTNSYLETLSL